MALESTHSSLLWDSASSPLHYQSSIISTIPAHYDRSLVMPLRLSPRKSYSFTTNIQLPPIKLRSPSPPGPTNEDEKSLIRNLKNRDPEYVKCKQKFDQLRAKLIQTLQDSRHKYNRAQYKRTVQLQTLTERDELINRLIVKSFELKNKVQELNDEIINQRRQRDNNEMRQSKLRRTLIQLNETKDEPLEILKKNDKTKLIEEYNNRLLQIKNAYKQELADRDKQIEKLKEKLSEEFHYQSDEYMKLLKATEQAFDTESQKCDILQECIDYYETNVYRAKKPCCISTSNRLSKVSTQLRLYFIIELTLHELFYSSYACGTFKRAYENYIRSHKK